MWPTVSRFLFRRAALSLALLHHHFGRTSLVVFLLDPTTSDCISILSSHQMVTQYNPFAILVVKSFFPTHQIRWATILTSSQMPTGSSIIYIRSSNAGSGLKSNASGSLTGNISLSLCQRMIPTAGPFRLVRGMYDAFMDFALDHLLLSPFQLKRRLNLLP
jgi:hypothetical protein